MTIREATAIDTDILDAFARLMPQLSPDNAVPTQASLEELLASESRLLLAYDAGGRITGTATLSVFRIPSGLRARLEDVIVDQTARGSGVGEALTRRALAIAQEIGCPSLDLTSNPAREAANRLYRRLGFQPRATNLYRFDL